MEEEIVTAQEIMIERTPQNLLLWVESKIQAIGESDTGLTDLRLGRGFAKQLMEEVFPIAIFASKKFGELDSILIKPIIGNQNYDATLTDKSCSPVLLKYLEVTQAHEGEIEYLRAFHLVKNGWVSTGPIIKTGTKKTGLEVSAQFEAQEVGKDTDRELGKILEAIKRKQGKFYHPNTSLIVKFDDGWRIRRTLSEKRIDGYILDNIVNLNLHFDELYLVGKFKELFLQYELKSKNGYIRDVVIKK